MNAEIVKVLRVEYSKYFKCFQVRFQARCPRCRSINKHGESYDQFPEKCHIKGTRGCDTCHFDYKIDWKQE